MTVGAIAAARDPGPPLPDGPGADWAALIEPVARRLLADRPCRQHGGDLRFGTHGSLVVHVAGPHAGTWRDFKHDAGGGTLALVEYLLQTDRAGALRWLADERLIEPGSSPNGAAGHRSAGNGARGSPVSDPPAAGGVSTPPESRPKPPPVAPTADVAAAILAASTDAAGTPAARYLDARATWPTAAGPLPAAVRWLAPEAWPDLPGWRGDDGRERHLHPPADMPPGAVFDLDKPPTRCGAVVYPLRRPGAAEPDAVTLEAVTADGRRLPWTDRPTDTKRTCGSATGRVFELPAAPGAPWATDAPLLAVALVEGAADALALARLRLPGVLIRGACGTSGMSAAAVADLPDVPAVVVSDGDKDGRAAVVKLTADLADAGRPVYAAVLLAGDLDEALRGADVADLAERHNTRAGILEYDAGADRPDATARALARLLVSHGGTTA